ncbi:histidine kinase [Gynurincola endophyticus]|uniref:histidine kinase n=1 Tax=Gynurincola endophyticus TaxID=2479004 RepID=UPI000F8CF276|nr:histidine kinase [Gynurincola endophyticus]
MKTSQYVMIAAISLVISVFLIFAVYWNGQLTFESYTDFGTYILKQMVLTVAVFLVIVGFVKTDKTQFRRNFWVILLVNVCIYLAMFFTSTYDNIAQIFSLKSLRFFIGYFVFSMCASYISAIFFNSIKRNLQATTPDYVTISFLFLSILGGVQLLYFVFANFAKPIFNVVIFYNNTSNYVLVGIITTFFLLLFFYIQRNKIKAEKKINIESTKAENVTAQFESLKSQLDPHFLFNSLNVLTGLIEENQENAIDFTTSLSKIYRYVLEQKDKEVVPVQEELNFAKSFVNLLKLRYENSISFELNETDFQESENIVPLSLQILLENTVKHNIVSSENPLKIRIYKEGNMLMVENNYQPKSTIATSTGIGLQNIQNRYELISRRRVEVNQTTEIFQVKIPLLTQKFKAMTDFNSSEDEAYKKALARAKELKGYYSTIGTFIILCIFFYLLDYVTTGGNTWWYWPALGMGIGAAVATLKVFGMGGDWEERKARELMDKDRNQNKWN